MINNPTAHANSFWSFEMFDSVLPGREGFTDLDGITEKNGNFLVLEFKIEGAPIPKGQRILFDALAALPQFNVIVVWGPTDYPKQAMIWGHHDFPVECDKDRLQSWIRRWRISARKSATKKQ